MNLRTRNTYNLSLKLFTTLCLSIIYTVLLGQVPISEQWNDTDNLPRYMTPTELERLDEIGQGFVKSPPPEGVVRNIAEFERMEGVLIRYPLGIPVELVAAMSEQVTVYTLVANSDRLTQATDAFNAGDVIMDNVSFITAPTNSMWTRDYGPWYIATEDKKIEIVDFIYNRPRARDNDIPGIIAGELDANYYSMDLRHCGGNLMVDGLGIGASTDLIIEENEFDLDRVLQKKLDYLGLHTYHITEDAQGEYIKHIDTWAKFLAVDKILIAEVPELHPRYHIYESIADYYKEQISSYGTPFQVYRVYSPQGQPYTNSLILNESVYVPISNSPWDEDALDVYKKAMPGYDVQGFTGNWISTDALHCRIKDMADRNMLYIDHRPLSGTIDYKDTIQLFAEIIPYSGAELVEDSLFLIVSKNKEPYDTLQLHAQNDPYSFSTAVLLTPGDTTISYYFKAVDESGKQEHWPLVGRGGARQVNINYQTDLRFQEDTIFFNYEDFNLLERQIVVTNYTPVAVNIDSVVISQTVDFPVQIVQSPAESENIPSDSSAHITLQLNSDDMDNWAIEKSSQVVIYSDGTTFSIPVVWLPAESTSLAGQITQKRLPLTIYPNPVDRQINIKWPSDIHSRGQLTVFDQSGKAHLTLNNIDTSNGDGSSSIQLGNNFKPGTYILKYTTLSGEVLQGTFIKI